MFRFLTAGESHGPALVAIVEGIPANLPLSTEQIDKELGRRQLGFGRGTRMKIEKDQVEVLSGVRHSRTMGSPITLLIRNKDWENWQEVMSPAATHLKPAKVTKPRPGHSDLAGALKFEQDDIRNVLERASARETAIRVAVGAVAKCLLSQVDISILSHATSIGGVWAKDKPVGPQSIARIDRSPVRCLDEKVAKRMIEVIKKAEKQGETLGGTFEVVAYGIPAGLGSYAQWYLRLDGRLARALMSIPAIKAVEVGEGLKLAELKGSQAHDEIFFEKKKGFFRKTNRAGGLEAGVTNGEPLVLRAAMKPIPTLGKPLQTVDILSKRKAEAFQERADICAVPSAAVVGEAVVAIELAQAVLEKFAGDSLGDLKKSYRAYLTRIKPVSSAR